MVDPVCGGILKTDHRKGRRRRGFPRRSGSTDAAWVGYRLAEVLPLEAAAKQELLEMEDAPARFQRLRRFLAEQGLAAPEKRDG